MIPGLCSVVIPTYNGENYMQEALDSVLSQDYVQKEIIVVDDGSDDDGPQLIENYCEKYPGVFKVLKNKHNMGIVHSVLSGISVSNAEFIALMGQDDVMFSNRLSVQVEALYRNQVSMVCSNAYYLYENKPSGCLVNPYLKSDQLIERRVFLFRNPVVGPTTLFRRQDFLLVDTEIFKFRNSVEWILWFQFARMSGVYYLATPLLYYRRHKSNISNHLFTSPEYGSYKKFCTRHVASRLSTREIMLSIFEYLLQKTGTALERKFTARFLL
jgi:glycosyltransferase involved in cell wall biosynthesis